MTGKRDLYVYALLVAAGLLLQLVPFVRLLDLWLIDQGFALIRSQSSIPVDDRVVVVGIDEASMREYPEPFALWHARIGKFLHAMAIAKPLVVGLDINLPERSMDFIAAGYDQALLKGLLAMRGVAPVVLGLSVDQAGGVKPVYMPYLALAGRGASGYVLWPVDRDHVVRRFDERLGVDGQKVPTLVGQIARRLQIEPKPGLINFAVGQPIDYIPLQTTVQWFERNDTDALRRIFGAKVVLLGSVLPFVDRYPQPINLAAWEYGSNSAAPGLLLHVQTLRSLMAGLLIESVPVTWVILFTLAAAVLWFAGSRIWVGLLGLGIFVLASIGLYLWALRGGSHIPLAAVLLCALLALASRAGFESGLQIKERLRLRRAFSGYVSPPVMQQILSGDLAPGLGGRRQRICVLFADIRGFTSRSETMASETVISLLNRYFEAMTQVIHEHGGTVDKFMGDGIMAFFGAPNTLDNPCCKALRAAQDMLVQLRLLNQALQAEELAAIASGIALHYGEAVVGHVGSADRHAYTAIGDVVNVASRLEGLTKETGYALLCTTSVLEACGSFYGYKALGEKQIKGHTPITVHAWTDSAII
ncbi:MAG: CHASE2 domain-containing protein [Burkholderiales bacterium]